MTNILFRYGDSRNLTFVLGKNTEIDWPQKFKAGSILPLYGEKPNILCSHAKFNKKPMNWLFPKETSKYITILRNPVDNFESAFNYNHLGKSFGIKDDLHSVQTFLNKQKLGENTLLTPLIRNPMLFDLGLDLQFFQNLSAVNRYIQFVEKEFDLVMIMDYFDESLVLLKRMLCWEMDDILYLKQNERQEKERAMNLDDKVKENIRRWNKADVLLFNHLNKTFWKKIEMEGESFYADLAVFRQRNDETRRMCVTDKPMLQTVFVGKVVKGHSLREDLPETLKKKCENLRIGENAYLAYLREKRKGKLLNAGLEQQVQRGNRADWNVATDLVYHSVGDA